MSVFDGKFNSKCVMCSNFPKIKKLLKKFITILLTLFLFSLLLFSDKIWPISTHPIWGQIFYCVLLVNFPKLLHSIKLQRKCSCMCASTMCIELIETSSLHSFSPWLRNTCGLVENVQSITWLLLSWLQPANMQPLTRLSK